MSVKIVSGSEWDPLQIQEGLSEARKKVSFIKEIQEFNGKVIFSMLNLPVEEGFTLFYFQKYRVHVHTSVLDSFHQKFSPFLEGDKLNYDNLINICIMVKDAGEGFRNILTRNLPYIDRYTILDTGSTDNTINIIREVLKNKRGELYEEPFINFRDSRNRLLDLASNHCHFNIMLDDSYVLCGKVREFLDFVRGDDVANSFSLVLEDQDTMYTSNRVTKPQLGLRYVNLVHEIIQSDNNALNISIPYEWGHIEDVSSDYMTGRTKGRKQKDINTLKQMLKENPEDPRTYYYLADSYICTKEWENALYWFKKRVELGGYNAEIQDSLYYISVISDMYLHHPWEECHDLYLKCYENDSSRAESLYFVGKHYLNVGMVQSAFMYLKQAYSLGMPTIQMSVRKNIYNYHIPKELASICYEMKDYKLGEECCRKALVDKSDTITNEWLNIFYHINKSSIGKSKTRVCPEKLICFVSPGGWKEWDGETLRTRGLGGSENFTIRYAEYLVTMGYKVAVFCKCKLQKEYNNVTYLPETLYSQFCSTYVIDLCIINRYPEYIPVSCLNNIKTYYVMHDVSTPNSIIALHPNLAGVLCISEWHKRNFLNFYQACESRTQVISYGIETEPYPVVEKEPFRFIYPNFPNRGLIQLLRIWPRIIARYPQARLDCFCDTQNSWVQSHWSEDMVEVDRMFIENKDTVINHGWVNGKTLRQFWSKAHVWFYPCTFQETCCLTAWEAAASKTLVVSNNLAALAESIGDRGVIVKGDASTSEWHDQILDRMFDVLDGTFLTDCVERNYNWVKTKNFSTVVQKFVDRFI